MFQRLFLSVFKQYTERLSLSLSLSLWVSQRDREILETEGLRHIDCRNRDRVWGRLFLYLWSLSLSPPSPLSLFLSLSLSLPLSLSLSMTSETERESMYVFQSLRLSLLRLVCVHMRVCTIGREKRIGRDWAKETGREQEREREKVSVLLCQRQLINLLHHYNIWPSGYCWFWLWEITRSGKSHERHSWTHVSLWQYVGMNKS